MKAELLELMGRHVGIDLLIADSAAPAASLEGILIGFVEDNESGPADAIALRVRSETSDTSFVHVLRAAYQDASWDDRGGRQALVVRCRDLTAVIYPNTD